MKIDNSIKSTGARVGSTQTRAAPPSGGTAAHGKSAGATQVDLSPAASAFQHGLEVANASPAFDAQRVSEIRQAIAEGRFQINPEKIADGLIESVRDMLAGRRGST